MKKVLTKFVMLGGIGLLMLSACKKDGTLVKTDGGKAGALNASASTLALDKSKLNDPAQVVSFTFSQPDYGYTAAVTNTLQIDAMGDNWVKPTSVTLGAKKNSVGYTTGDFNALLLKLNLVGGVASQVQVRVQHSIGGAAAPIYSNVLTLNVTPFNLKSFIYVPGAYQGWDPKSADSLLSTTSNGIYTGIINYTAGNLEFKITPVKTWDHSYGSTGAGKVQLDGGGNIVAPAAGLNWVTLDVNANTITFAPVDAYYSIIGDGAKGWDAGDDVDMKYDNGNQWWSVVTPLVSTGSFKIRKNHDWAISYGVPKTDPAEGQLNNNSNNNISIPSSGTYKVTFEVKADPLAAYTLTKQ